MSANSFSYMDTLDITIPHVLMTPVKKINSGQDVSTFLVSQAYRDLTLFVVQLNRSMFPRVIGNGVSEQREIQVFNLGTPLVRFSDAILQLRELLDTVGQIIDEVPLDTGPRRFGNVSFRKWHELVDFRAQALLEKYLPAQVRAFKHTSDSDPFGELHKYFLGSFGSPQRLDYGTGHELSFLAFLAGIWKLGGFPSALRGDMDRQIILGVLEPYLSLVRRLINIYNLEPAGSHGVWGLDDHAFLPYVFGSAQYGPPIKDTEHTPTEGSLAGAPDPANVTNASLVEKERKTNLYFGAIGFIYDVKTGPFWEHSPTLYDISGIQAGWAKINKGMMKMYNAEVLSKFPVIQHFPFGSLFSWDRDPNAAEQHLSVHATTQPIRDAAASTSISSASMRYPVQESTHAPRVSSRTSQPEAISGSQSSLANRQPQHPRAVLIATEYSPVKRGSAVHAVELRRTNSAAHDLARRPAREATANVDVHTASMPPPTKAP